MVSGGGARSESNTDGGDDAASAHRAMNRADASKSDHADDGAAARLVESWRIAARDPRVGSLMRELEADAAELLRAHRPVCLASGRCCRFEEHGHSMWLTGLEVAWTLSQLPTAPTADAIATATRQGTCPFLVAGQCGIHLARPLGCRAYFCDQAGAGWQEAAMESWLGRVRALHQELEVEYRYDEWRRLLAAFSAFPAGSLA